MTRSRPALLHETPRYGSVWTWGEPRKGSIRRIALGVSGTRLLCVAIDPAGAAVIDTEMIWGPPSGPLSEWYCIDEGPE